MKTYPASKMTTTKIAEMSTERVNKCKTNAKELRK